MAHRKKFTDVESIFEGRLRGNQAMLSGLDLDDNHLGDEVYVRNERNK